MKTEKIKEVLVGNYRLGSRRVDVYLRTNIWSAEFDTNSSVKDGKERVTIGHDGTWHEVVAKALHEFQEFVLSDYKARFCPDIDWARATDGFVFSFNHDTYSQVCAIVGYTLAECLPDLSKAYNKLKSSKR